MHAKDIASIVLEIIPKPRNENYRVHVRVKSNDLIVTQSSHSFYNSPTAGREN